MEAVSGNVIKRSNIFCMTQQIMEIGRSKPLWLLCFIYTIASSTSSAFYYCHLSFHLLHTKYSCFSSIYHWIFIHSFTPYINIYSTENLQKWQNFMLISICINSQALTLLHFCNSHHNCPLTIQTSILIMS